MLAFSSRAKSILGRKLHSVTSAHRSLALTTLKAEQQNGERHASQKIFAAIASACVATLACAAVSDSESEPKRPVRDVVLEEEKFSTIIVGGGTAGCTVAYLTAKWMQENHLPGKVLLLDRGVHFFDEKNGPHPSINNWYENWGSFGEAHVATREDGTLYPVTVRVDSLPAYRHLSLFVHLS